jgi:flagellar FliJ protein
MDSNRLRPIQQIAAHEYAQPPAELTSAAQLLNRRAFLDRLDDALKQQQQAVRRAEENCDLERTRLLLASREKAVLEKLSAAYAKREAHVDNQRAQRELDDHAARQHLRGSRDPA